MKNRIPRIYIETDLKINKIIILDSSNAHYIIKVLRMNIQNILEIFNNTNYIFTSKIINIKKNVITVLILKKEKRDIESPLFIHLGLAISKNKKMNFSIQKSVELGVNVITPIFSQYSNINRNHNNMIKKINYWKNIIISSCKQCKRNIIPKINNVETIDLWCKKSNKNEIKIVLDTKSKINMNQLPDHINYIKLLIGSEGGFSSLEMQKIIECKFIPIKLGPRILRAETAAIAALTALQLKFGDLFI